MALLPLAISPLTQRSFSHLINRIYAMILLGIVTLALAISILLLIISLTTNRHATDLLGSAAILWSVNVLVFALWYWEIDGGGPMKRHQAGHQAADFMFPLTRPAKTLMMIEAMLSLTIIVLLAARAVNILES